jgi:hypothetical protein
VGVGAIVGVHADAPPLPPVAARPEVPPVPAPPRPPLPPCALPPVVTPESGSPDLTIVTVSVVQAEAPTAAIILNRATPRRFIDSKSYHDARRRYRSSVLMRP